ncbi:MULTISPECIES: DUF3667 domain-containing protein [Kordiimonas]|jgi:hypothetical protein|uniref:DUF3667 domain-containing protein n=1 Tax=Kordiimonas TaxID=288021 RepID=UPI002579F976|nr:DUF3667 domain-containing protein [Kordiimonas sp. UBA4487]
MAETQSAKAVITCKNCDAYLHGSFCSACGQKHIPSRLSAKELFVNAFFAFMDLDSTIWRTIRELTRNPGQVALNYIGGQRFSYVNPIKYFLVTSAFALAVIALTIGLDTMADGMVHIDGDVKETDTVFQIGEALRSVLRENMNLISFLTLPLFAFLLRWQYWRSGRNYAETLSFLAFAMGQTNLYSALLVIVLAAAGSSDQGISVFIGFIVLLHAAKVFFGMSWPKAFFAVVLSSILQSITGILVAGILVLAKMAGLI